MRNAWSLVLATMRRTFVRSRDVLRDKALFSKRALRFACIVVLASSPSVASAEPNEAAIAAARQLAEQGGDLLLAKDFAGAVAKLELAYGVVKLPTVAFHLGHALEMSGRWVEAAERYREAELMPVPDTMRDTHEDAKKRATERLAALAPRIPKLVIEVEGAGTVLSVTIDGIPVPPVLVGTGVPADPGSHVVAAESGGRRATATAIAVESETARVTLTLPEPEGVVISPPPPSELPAPTPVAPKPAPPPAPPLEPTGGAWMTPVGWIALGLGGAGVVTGAITGGLLLAQNDDIPCVDDACVPSAADDVKSFNTLRPVSTIGFVVGAVGVVGGVTLLLLAPDDPHERSVTLTPRGLVFRSRF